MFIHFPKKTLFSKFISGIIVVSFILTSVPVRSYAALGAADKLSVPVAAGKHADKAVQIGKELKKISGSSEIASGSASIKGEDKEPLLPNKQEVLEKLRNPAPQTIFKIVISDFASDTDTVVSAIAEAYRIKEAVKLNGYKEAVDLKDFSDVVVFPVIQGKLNDETLFILKEAGINPADLIFMAEDNVEDLLAALASHHVSFNITLTDHSKLTGKKENLGALNERISHVIDHHPISDKIKPAEAIYEKVGSTNTLIFERFVKYGIPIPKNAGLLMLSAILSDTKNLVVNTTDRDKKAVEELRNILAYSEQELNNLFVRQTRALNTIDIKNPLEKIFNPDNLRYFTDTQGQKFSFTTFRLNYGEEDLFNKLWPEISDHLKTDIQNNNLAVAFFNLTYLNEKGGLSDKGEELYIVGDSSDVIRYMLASEIPYEDKLEKVKDFADNISIYRLKRNKNKDKDQAPWSRKIVVEKILNNIQKGPFKKVEGRSGASLSLDINSIISQVSQKFNIPEAKIHDYLNADKTSFDALGGREFGNLVDSVKIAQEAALKVSGESKNLKVSATKLSDKMIRVNWQFGDIKVIRNLPESPDAIEEVVKVFNKIVAPILEKNNLDLRKGEDWRHACELANKFSKDEGIVYETTSNFLSLKVLPAIRESLSTGTNIRELKDLEIAAYTERRPRKESPDKFDLIGIVKLKLGDNEVSYEIPNDETDVLQDAHLHLILEAFRGTIDPILNQGISLKKDENLSAGVFRVIKEKTGDKYYSIYTDALGVLEEVLILMNNKLAMRPRALVIKSSFFGLAGATSAIQNVTELFDSKYKIGLWGPGADKVKALLGGGDNIITADTEQEAVAKLNTAGVDPKDIAPLEYSKPGAIPPVAKALKKVANNPEVDKVFEELPDIKLTGFKRIENEVEKVREFTSEFVTKKTSGSSPEAPVLVDINSIISEALPKLNIPKEKLPDFTAKASAYVGADKTGFAATGGNQLRDFVDIIKNDREAEQKTSGELTIRARLIHEESDTLTLEITLQYGDLQVIKEISALKFALSNDMSDDLKYVLSEINEKTIAFILKNLKKEKFDLRKKVDFEKVYGKIYDTYVPEPSLDTYFMRLFRPIAKIINEGLWELRDKLLEEDKAHAVESRAIIVDAADYFKTPGAISTLLEYLRLAGDTFKIGIFGKGAENFRILLGEDNIIAAESQSEVETKLRDINIRVTNIKLLPSSETPAISAAVRLAALFPTDEVKKAFGEFYSSMPKAGVITPETYGKTKAAMLEAIDTSSKSTEIAAIELPKIELTKTAQTAIDAGKQTVADFITAISS